MQWVIKVNGMNEQLNQVVMKELEQFHCSNHLDEFREKVRKLKSYGVEDTELKIFL